MPSEKSTAGQQPTIVTGDLFCGAGGFSQGLREAADELGFELRSFAVNHWDVAVETHERNHPDAHQYHSKVEQLHPPNVAEQLTDGENTPNVDLLVGGPSCTHHSRARGGKPVSEQKRMSPWHVLNWLELLDVDAFIIENVSELLTWGPVNDGNPVKDGSIFDAWIDALNALGYAVDWAELTAADFGDPTNRERLFIVGRQHGSATFPEPTHSDEDPEKPDRRTAAEIIDWSDLGSSIWTRDLTHPRVHTPPKDRTMQRIAEGLRIHCADVLEPFADVLEQLGRPEIRALREQHVVPAEYADQVAAAVDEPFLVKMPAAGTSVSASHLLRQQDGGPPWGGVHEQPVPTIASKGAHALVTTQLLRQQDGKYAHAEDVHDFPVPTILTSGNHSIATTEMRPLVMPKNGRYRGIHSNPLYPAHDQPAHTITADPRAKLVSPTLVRYSHGGAALDVDDPMPTIATEKGGVFALSSPYLTPLYSERSGQQPRTRTIDRPTMTVPGSKSPAAVTTPMVRPFIEDFQGPPKEVTEPLPTQTGNDRFALCVPELWPWGLDIRYRMLQPRELKQAQGFPADYELAGTKSDRTEQIGNAVPVNLAKALCKHVLTDDDPSLASFGGGFTGKDDPDIPAYDEVAGDD